jgi:hypothetical protein
LVVLGNTTAFSARTQHNPLHTLNTSKRAQMQDEPKFTKTSPVNGYFIWQRNEHLTLKKGPIHRPWRKKLDEATGR